MPKEGILFAETFPGSSMKGEFYSIWITLDVCKILSLSILIVTFIYSFIKYLIAAF